MSIKELSQSILDASKAVIELSEMKIGIQIVPGSEKKLMPLAKKAGVRFMKPALAKSKEMGEKTFTCAGKTYTVDEVEPIMKGDEEGKKKIVKEKDVKETTMMSGKPEKKSIAQVRRDMQKSVKDANQKLKDAEMRKKERLRKMSTMKESLLPIIEEFGVDLVSEVLDSVKKFESLDEAGPIGSVGIRQDFKQDSNRDARMADWKKKQAAMKPIDRMKKKLEQMRTQRQRHDDAASKYRDQADKVRERNPKDSNGIENYNMKADRQEEMADDLNRKIQDLKDDIRDMTDKAKGK